MAQVEDCISEFSLVVPKTAAGMRLDAFLGQSLDEFSRSYLKKLIQQGLITIAGLVPKPSRSVKPGEEIEIRIPTPESWDVVPQEIPISIVYEDSSIVVVNKSAGMVVHPSPGHRDGTLVNALLHHCGELPGINGVLRPGVVHRLDAGTSGLIVFARDDRAMSSLTAQFKNREVRKRYFAIVHGEIPRDHFIIDEPIGRHRTDFRRMAVRRDVGKHAVTEILSTRPFHGFSAVHVAILTGRTHQIRVHMRHIGHPLVCDSLYGREAVFPPENPTLQRCALHSYSLSFRHPVGGRNMHFSAPLPDDIRLTLFRLKEQR
ncbi:MAG: RluA family pseudouridine synthase [Planctomycetota bacterium]